MTEKPVVRFLDRTTAPHVLTLILLAGVSALNMSVFLPSLNGMTAYFETEYAVMQLAVSGYLAATAVLQVLVGPLADRFGRRPVVLWALALFTLATIGALFAPTVEVFLAFRMAQAVVATGMVLSRAVVRDMVPADQAASMIGYVTMGMALVPMVGPMVGGALDQLFGWHATFVFLAGSGALVWALCYRDLGETVSGGGVRFRDQLRSYPELLTSPRFWGYVACAAFGSGAFFALLGGASFVAGTTFHLSPFWTGMALGSPAIGYAVGNGISGRLSVRVGIDRMILWGTGVSTFGMGLSLILSLGGVNDPLVFFGLCTFLGLGNGIMLPNATAGSLSVRPHLAGTASGLGGAIMIGGGAALSALAGSLLTEETGAIPLQVIMLVTSALAAVSILLVMARTRALGEA
ncbi:Bcr/CflA family efflux MFS transporter [Loktanella sp. IMCC34160]|uniref:multidrug effflux MFS transporter n=1 Tax=Loktanella sp. IMCC34160 TaxID=2510646 RepID=UPI00101BB2C6|nr:multidrug effflux MFS transporter [Loktanella sp. IMCC34160]RYG92354.1 Bcr/CflA family efflux MFS transporter [Loktanella sp. IMCC34160]